MTTAGEKFLRELQATFRVEAAEHLQAIAAGLLELEKTPAPDAQAQIIETVFRAAHSLKGAARAVDHSRIESLCQSLEEVFASWKRGTSVPSSGALDTLHRTLDAISSTIAASAGSSAADARGELTTLRKSLRHSDPSTDSPAEGVAAAAAGGSTDSTSTEPAASEAAVFAAHPASEKGVADETVRVSVAKLEARLLQSEELLNVKLAAGQRAAELHELTEALEKWQRGWAAVEPDVRELRQANDRPTGRRSVPGLVRVLEFFESGLDTLKSLENTGAALRARAERDSHVVGRLVDDLLDDSKKLLLLPFATISTAFPKLVRDLCRDQGKEAGFSIRGEDIEIDKRILEEMKDPLVHLLRNSIDHGIEAASERTQRGKPARASITLSISRVNGNKVELVLADDGAGIDTARVKASAVRHGLIAPDQADALGEAEAQALIFQSELSTSPMITKLSGRGLGLAIVREKVDKLGGEIAVESRKGQGTAFRIVLPATRATFRGILVEAGGQLLVVPSAQVDRVARAKQDDVRSVEGRETIVLQGRALSLVRLADVLELPAVGHEEGPGGVPVIVLGARDQRVAFAVDAVLDEQEVLVKPLQKPLSRVRNVAGATVLGSGRVAPVLNVGDLLKSARNVAARPAPLAAAKAPEPAQTKTILVAEDSITSRMLIKSILESAGYRVKTAVNGLDAFTLLRAEPFDLVVSDVEMPRLNGFDLTARIRADRTLADLPVVLVTALATREDRERGVDAGANAYIVKASFDQSDLLEAVRRLI